MCTDLPPMPTTKFLPPNSTPGKGHYRDTAAGSVGHHGGWRQFVDCKTGRHVGLWKTLLGGGNGHKKPYFIMKLGLLDSCRPGGGGILNEIPLHLQWLTIAQLCNEVWKSSSGAVLSSEVNCEPQSEERSGEVSNQDFYVRPSELSRHLSSHCSCQWNSLEPLSGPPW